jgi:hypothetical protein
MELNILIEAVERYLEFLDVEPTPIRAPKVNPTRAAKGAANRRKAA